MLKLTVQHKDRQEVHELPDGKPVYVGRDPECEIHLTSPMVSRRHAVFMFKNGICAVKDLDSNNGTTVNGELIIVPSRLSGDDVVEICGYTIVFADERHKPPETSRPVRVSISSRIARKPAPASASASERPAEAETESDDDIPAAILETDVAPPPIKPDFLADVALPSSERGDTLHLPRRVAESGNDPKTAPGPLRFEVEREFGPGDDDLARVPIDESLERAMEKRLALFDKLADLAEERRFLRMRKDGLPQDVEAELLRQDGELECIPTADQADELIEEHKLRTHFVHPEAEPRPEMQKALDLALEQWRLCRDFNREALPKVFFEAYRIMAEEPLAVELSQAEIYHLDLFGAAAYYLAVEDRHAGARKRREGIRDSTRKLAARAERRESGVLRRIEQAMGGFADRENRKAEAELLSKSEAEASGEVRRLAREMSYLEKILVDSFWRAYYDAAAFFLTRNDPPPLPVRAMLRFGVLGIGPWWLRKAAKNRIVSSCLDDTNEKLPIGLGVTGVVYADEHLSAVLAMESHPRRPTTRKDEEAAEWRIDRAWRKLADARAHRRRLVELATNLEREAETLVASGGRLEARLANIEDNPAYAQEKYYDLMRERQSLASRHEHVAASLRELEKRINGDLRRRIEENENRLKSGEPALPTPDEVVLRECEAIREMAGKLSGSKPVFPPFLVRELPLPGDDDLNDRRRVAGFFDDFESRDPCLFQQTVFPAKKREHRIAMRVSPTIVVAPCFGKRVLCVRPRRGMDGGIFYVPLRFSDERGAMRSLCAAVADYRWESSRREAGLDVFGSDTLAGAFMKIRWDWRGYSRERRERGLIRSDLNDRDNWRLVYEAYINEVYNGGQKLFQKNPELYEAIIGTYIELPSGVELLRK